MSNVQPISVTDFVLSHDLGYLEGAAILFVVQGRVPEAIALLQRAVQQRIDKELSARVAAAVPPPVVQTPSAPSVRHRPSPIKLVTTPQDLMNPAGGPGESLKWD